MYFQNSQILSVCRIVKHINQEEISNEFGGLSKVVNIGKKISEKTYLKLTKLI